MGPEAAINAVYANRLADVEDEAERERMEAELREAYREGHRRPPDGKRGRHRRDRPAERPPCPASQPGSSSTETVEKDLPEKKHGTVI